MIPIESGSEISDINSSSELGTTTYLEGPDSVEKVSKFCENFLNKKNLLTIMAQTEVVISEDDIQMCESLEPDNSEIVKNILELCAERKESEVFQFKDPLQNPTLTQYRLFFNRKAMPNTLSEMNELYSYDQNENQNLYKEINPLLLVSKLLSVLEEDPETQEKMLRYLMIAYKGTQVSRNMFRVAIFTVRGAMLQYCNKFCRDI